MRYISFNTEIRTIDYRNQIVEFPFTYTETDSSGNLLECKTIVFHSTHSNDPFHQLPNSLISDVPPGSLKLEIEQNDLQTTRELVINFYIYVHIDDSWQERDVESVIIYQNGKLNEVKFPIWKTTEITFPSVSESTKFDLRTENQEVLYKGSIYVDTSGEAKLTLNPIVENYLDMVFPENVTSENWTVNTPKFFNTLNLYVNDVFNRYIKYYPDWSYKDSHTTSYYYGSDILPYVDSRQLYVFSFANTSDNSANALKYTFGKDWRDTKTGPVVGEIFKEETNVMETSRVITAKLWEMNGIQNIGVQLYRGLYQSLIPIPWINVKKTCMDYCLIYRTPDGLYKTMLFNRTSLPTDSFKRETYLATTNTQRLMRGGQTIYSNQITEKIKLKTPLLNDKQSEMMADVFRSPETYIQDLNNPESIVKCNITSGSVNRQTFWNNGRKFARYDLEITKSLIKKVN